MITCSGCQGKLRLKCLNVKMLRTDLNETSENLSSQSGINGRPNNHNDTPHKIALEIKTLQLMYYKVGMGSRSAYSLGSLLGEGPLGRIPLPSPPSWQEDGPPPRCLPWSCPTTAALQQMEYQFTNSPQFVGIIKGVLWDPKGIFTCHKL